MKQALLVVGCLFLFLIGCKNKDEFTISGQIENPGNIKVVSLYEGERKLDSMFLEIIMLFNLNDLLVKHVYYRFVWVKIGMI